MFADMPTCVMQEPHWFLQNMLGAAARGLHLHGDVPLHTLHILDWLQAVTQAAVASDL